MPGICDVDGCDHPRTTYGRLCAYHKRADRRHGHPLQTSLKVTEVAPYVRRVAARMAKEPGREAWKVLRQRWEILVDEGRSLEAARQRGEVTQATQRAAFNILLNVARDVTPDTVISMVLAVYMLREDRPHRFKSDEAFDFQMARRVRALSDVYVASYVDPRTGAVKRVYRDLPPRVLQALAEMLKAAFGVAGNYVARLEQREIEAKRKADAALYAALEGLES